MKVVEKVKGFGLFLVLVLTFGLAGCHQTVSQQSFQELKKQVPGLQKESQNLRTHVKQVNETVQSLKARSSSADISSKSHSKNNPRSTLNPPNDFVKVTNKVEVRKALKTIIPSAFPNDPKAKKWQIKRLKLLPRVDTYYQMGIHAGGKSLADLSWFVEVHFPAYEPSASLSNAQLFIAKSKSSGWVAWYKY